MSLVIGVCGKIGSGKTTIANYLTEKGFDKVEMGDIVREEAVTRGIPLDRAGLEGLADEELRKDKEYWINKVIERVKDNDTVISGIRALLEVKKFKAAFPNFYLIGVDIPAKVRFERLKKRGRVGDPETWEEFQKQESAEEQQFDMSEVVETSDYKITGVSYGEEYEQMDEILNEIGVKKEANLKFSKKYTNEEIERIKDEHVRYHVGMGLVNTEDWNTLEKFLEKEKEGWVKSNIEQEIANKILEKHFGSSSLKFSDTLWNSGFHEREDEIAPEEYSSGAPDKTKFPFYNDPEEQGNLFAENYYSWRDVKSPDLYIDKKSNINLASLWKQYKNKSEGARQALTYLSKKFGVMSDWYPQKKKELKYDPIGPPYEKCVVEGCNNPGVWWDKEGQKCYCDEHKQIGEKTAGDTSTYQMGVPEDSNPYFKDNNERDPNIKLKKKDEDKEQYKEVKPSVWKRNIFPWSEGQYSWGSLKFSKEYTREEIERIKESGTDEERRKLAKSLYEDEDNDTLKTMINDSNADVRRRAAASLYDNNDYATLKTMINDSNEYVREYVAEGLLDSKDYDTLKTMINDSDEVVRYYVATGLYKNKDYDTLKTMIDDSDEVVRYYVGYSLVDTEDWNTLQEFLEKEENRWVKSSVEQYIADKILEKHFGSLKFSFKKEADLNSLMNNLVERFPNQTDAETYIREIINKADPTKDEGNYTPWVATQLLNNQISLPDDTKIVYDLLRFYDINRKKQFFEYKDIYAIDFNTLQLYINKLKEEGIGREKSRKELKHPEISIENMEGVEEIYNDGTFKILKVTSIEAVIESAKGTSWCTKKESYAEEYLDEGPIYRIYKNNKAYASLSNSGLKNVRDYDIDLLKNIELQNVLLNAKDEVAHYAKYYVAKGLYKNKDYDTLKTMINDSDDDVRNWVAWSLYDNKDFGTLKTMINDSDSWVRYWVAWSLYKNKDYDTLKTMINDSYNSVRYCVGCGLVDSEDWNTLEKFLEKEKDEDIKKEIEKYKKKKE